MDRIAVLIRVPGDPTSVVIADALLIDPEKGSRDGGRPCYCTEAGREFYLEPEYYRRRSARLHECPALLGRFVNHSLRPVGERRLAWTSARIKSF